MSIVFASILLKREKLGIKPEKQLTPLIMGQFESVDVTDATILELPDKLASEHNGYGGDGSEAALKIQATFNVKSMDFSRIDVVITTQRRTTIHIYQGLLRK